MKIQEKKLHSQEPCIIDCDNDFFDTYPTIEKIERLLKNGDITNGVQILGLFDAYGEGKSSLIHTLKHQHKNKYCFIELDLWKYTNNDIKKDFHKVFYNETSRYFIFDRIRNTIFNLLSKVKKFQSLSEILVNKSFIEYKMTDDYFAYGLNAKIRKRKKKENCKKRKTVILIENMDRLTIEEKVTALSSIYNYRNSFESHIIITLDPDSVQNTTTYFEKLVYKCFTAYMYFTPKTKHTFRQYIQKQLLILDELKSENKEESEEIHQSLTEMLLTQYPISLREINHCINTYVMNFIGENAHNLKLFMAILQVQYPQFYRAISQNPYILKKFMLHANDSAFNEYSDYNIPEEQAYKLNLLIKSLGDLHFEDISKDILFVLSPLNKDFLQKNTYDLHESIMYIELLRKAQLEKDVITKIEKIIEENDFSVNELDKFLTEVIKDRTTFINFFESQNFEEIDKKLQIFSDSDTSLFLETILSYNVEKINDYTFYDNYSKIMKIFKKALEEKKYARLLIQRILENFQLARQLIHDNVTIEDSNYFVLKLKRLSFIKKILYTTHFFEATDTTTILTLENIIKSSIVDLDMNKFDKIENFKQKSIESFYLEAIPTNRYDLSSVALILDIVESQFFERLNVSKKVKFYEMVFDNATLMGDDNFNLVIQKFSTLLNELFLITDIEIVIEILEKIKIIDFDLSGIHPLVLQKFIKDNCELFGKYDEELNKRISGLE